MGLEIGTGKVIFVNISKGKLFTKEKGGEPQYFDTLTGTIVSVTFKEDEFDGKKFELALIKVNDGDENFLLQMRTDSGYFRGFCNSLKSANYLEKVSISASSKTEDDKPDKPKTTCFISQNKKALKHFYTKDNIGDLPQLEKVSYKGQDLWDGSKQITFWKNWLTSIEWVKLSKGDSPEPQQKIDSITDIQAVDDLPF